MRIREAARSAFLASGYQAVSMESIQRAAGIASKETLYRYYRSKEELFLDVVRSLTVDGPILGRFLEQEPVLTTVKELSNFLRVVVQGLLGAMLQSDYVALMRILIAELPRLPELGPMFRQTVPAQAIDYLMSLVQRCQKDGVIPPSKDPEVVARLILGAPLTYAIFDGMLRRSHSIPDMSVVDAIVENLLEGVCR